MTFPKHDFFTWSWYDFCGRQELKPWNKKYQDFDICFQYLAFQVPVLSVLAILSAFYSGALHLHLNRCRRDKWILGLRCFFTLLLAAIPIVRTYFEENKFPGQLRPADFLLAAIQCFAWFVHFCYLMSLSNHIGPSLRGPVLMGVIWALNYILSWINLHSNYLIQQDPDSVMAASKIPFVSAIVQTSIQTLYLLTLLPLGQSYPQVRFQSLSLEQYRENSPFSSYAGFREDFDPGYLGIAGEGYCFLGKLGFNWVNPLLKKGAINQLETVEDLFDLPVSLSSTHIQNKICTALNISKRSSTQASLLNALHSCFWKEFYGIGILKFISDISGFCGPLLLNKLVNFIEDATEPIENGCLYALGLSLSATIVAFCSTHYTFKISIVGLKIRAAVISLVYRKILLVNSVTLSNLSEGEITNYMSIDVDRIVNSCASFHALWSIPFQVFTTLYLLYLQVGISFLAGVIFSIILIPINRCLATQIGKLSQKMMGYKDKRIQATGEVLNGIFAIKVYVWEKFFLNKILDVRAQEVSYLSKRKYLDAVCVYFWATTPVLISVLTFITHVYLGKKLTAATVFTSIALLNMLIAPLNAFPWVLNGVVEAWISIKRVQKLIELRDLKFSEFYDGPVTKNENTALAITNANFFLEKSNFFLKSINLEGQFIGIIGPVGSGKTLLMDAILAELEKTIGTVFIDNHNDGIGYVSQTPWLQTGTIQENILFGEPFVNHKYWAVLNSCGLVQDIESFPNKDKTIVGCGGSTLSGGQKARIALARAAYQDKHIYLMDDVLSAVDPHVANNIFNNCICALLANKTRILCTHQLNYLIKADIVVMMEDGKIIKQGPPAQVLPNFMEFATEAELNEKLEAQLPSESFSCESEAEGNIEERATGTIEWKVWLTYLGSIGCILWSLIVIVFILMQISRNSVDWWLAYWVTSITNPNSTSNDTTLYYITVYSSIALFNSIFTLFRAFLFAYGGIKAAKKIHYKLLSRVIRLNASFFHSNSVGRITNRFSSDVNTVDDSLPFIFNILMAVLFTLIGSLAVTIYSLPWLCLVLAPLIPIYHSIQGNYRQTSRELKRLASVSLSPLYNHFTETVRGAVTIRAFRASSRFMWENLSWLEANQKAQLNGNAASQWLSLRLQLIGVAIITGVASLAVLQHHLEVAEPGLIGLAISYALSLTGAIGGLVNAFTETEKEIVSVERINQYINDENIEEESDNFSSPPFAWPAQGIVSFTNVYFRYRDHLPYVLKGITFSTRPAEKIGIVGRTGAGKSSIIKAIFRLVEISKGNISVDFVNTKLMSIKHLRTHLGIIPQDPFIFEETIQTNLDPLKMHTSNDIYDALIKAHVKEFVDSLGGINKIIKQGQLSTGQTQLLCLARCILHNAKIVCIDEATSNVDIETDRLIQETIRHCFRLSTVITIAHRIKTIIDYDRVLVIDEGQVVEFDTPNKLLQDNNSLFYQLANEHQ